MNGVSRWGQPAHGDAPAHRPLLEAWLIGAMLAALMIVLHHDVVFGGRSLVHSNHFNPFDSRPLPENYGDDLVPHTEWANRNLWLFSNIRDPGATWWQWEPSTHFLKMAAGRREWPFWNPYVAAGAPAMTNLVPAFFFPPYALMVALGASVGLKNAYFLFLLWAASVLSALFLRRHGLSLVASVAGGTMVMVGGAMNQNLGAFAGQTAACVPLALYATRLFFEAPRASRAAGLALTYAVISLASFPPILLGVFGVTAAYGLVALAVGDCGPGAMGRWKAGGWWLAAMLLSVGLVSCYYLPALVLSGAVPQVAEIYRTAGLETMPIRNILQLLSPTLMGGVQVYLSAPFASPGWGAHIPYVGIVCVTAAVLASPRSRQERTLYVTSAATATVILLKLVGAPPVQWVGHLPFFKQIHFAHYLGIVLGFPLVFLAAQGLDSLLRGRTSSGRLLMALGVPIAATGSLWWIAQRSGAFEVEGASYWVRDWWFLATFSGLVVAALAAAVGARVAPQLARVRTAVAGLLLGVIVAEGAYNNFRPKPAAWDTFEHPVPYMRVLRKEAAKGRVFGFGVPAANGNEAFRVFGVDSAMAFNPPRIFELYQRYAAPPREVFMRMAARLPPDPVLDRANVSFVGTYSPAEQIVGEAIARRYVRRFDNGITTLFSRDTPPRFFFSSEYRVMRAPEVLEAIAVAPPDEILLEDDPHVPLAPNASGDPEVTVDAYGLNSFTLVVDAPRPGLVYASESYFDGWSAIVDGIPARILPANYAFRAVAVPAGRSRIEFTYWPPGLSAGLVMSGVSVVVLALLVMLDRRTLHGDGEDGDRPRSPAT
jgi:Bacterial membrane protein YfhO